MDGESGCVSDQQVDRSQAVLRSANCAPFAFACRRGLRARGSAPAEIELNCVLTVRICRGISASTHGSGFPVVSHDRSHATRRVAGPPGGAIGAWSRRNGRHDVHGFDSESGEVATGASAGAGFVVRQGTMRRRQTGLPSSALSGIDTSGHQDSIAAHLPV